MASNVTMLTNYGGTTVTDRRFKPIDQASPVSTAQFAASQDMTTLDAWLTAANGTYWTAARLAQESWWDKLFFMRSSVPGGLA